MSFINENNIKSNLSRDLLLYITHLEEALDEIEESEEKKIIQEWLFLILENSNEDIAMARIRNMALGQLSMDIEFNKLKFPFNERPSRHTYDKLVDWLKTVLNQNTSVVEDADILSKAKKLLVSAQNRINILCDFMVSKTLTTKLIEINKHQNKDLKLDDFKHLISADNRTYIALQNLPNNSGMFGYIAVTIGDDGDIQWLNSKGQPITSLEPTNLPVQQVEDHFQELMPKHSDVKKVWYVLKNRKPLYFRNYSLQFYERLYEIIQQEMLSEKNYGQCSHPFIHKLLKYFKIDLEAIGIKDPKMFIRFKMLSILKKQIKFTIKEIKNRSETLETAMKVSTISPIVSLPQKCCYNFVSAALWNEVSEQRPGTKYIEVLSNKYQKCIFPIYFSVLSQKKKQVLTSIFSKYCKILDEMFIDLEKAIMSNMKKYRNAKWEWNLAYEVINEYIKEKSFKDSLCTVENSVDESTNTFLAVILNEMEMAESKLSFIKKKNDKMAKQLPDMRNEIGDKDQLYITTINEYEEKIKRLKKEIKNEKRDIMKRENTILELQKKIQELVI